jgi:hypothetical protein
MRYHELSPRQGERDPRPGWRWRLVCLLIVALAGRTAAAVEDIATRYFGMAVQGDLAGAEAMLQSGARSSRAAADLAKRFRDRFVGVSEVRPPVSDRAVVNEIVEAYRRYWRVALMGQAGLGDAEKQLQAELRLAMERHGAAAALMTDVETQAAVGRLLTAAGFGVQQGRTPPLMDLLLWRTEQRRDYAVDLTDGVQPVSVRFLSDFVVKGWLDYATFGHASAGGWATDDALYCLADRYDTASETFLVSYLKHEARHFADYQLFPGLPSTDMEYRAKLTELIYAESTLQDLLAQFEATAADDPSASHAFAAHQVIEGLKVSALPPGSMPGDPLAIRRESRRQLDWHTSALVEGGEALVSRGVFASGVPGLVEDSPR